jgi:hypothetical protein
MPRSDWSTDITTPWWLEDEKYMVGKLTQKTRKIRIVNTLTKDDHLLEVNFSAPMSYL